MLASSFNFFRPESATNHAAPPVEPRTPDSVGAVYDGIANVAHDLKTPLASFMTGLSLVLMDLNELENILGNKLPSSDVNDLKSRLFQPMYDQLNGIQDLNRFMISSINRVLETSKASKGLKLVPKYESFSLEETVNLPLLAMQSIQSGERISLKPIDFKGIAGTIVTDKHWFQENILCLLSNASKYSSEGKIELRVTLEKKDAVPANLVVLQESEGSTHPLKAPSSSSKKHSPSPPNKAQQQHRHSAAAAPGHRQSAGDSSNKNLPRRSSLITSSEFLNRLTSIFQRKSSRIHVYAAPENEQQALKKSPKNKPQEHRQSASSPPSDDHQFHHGSHSFDKSLFLRVEVEDHGIGMSEEAMGKLFHPFHQNQRLAGGTGLGLYSLSKRIEALGGEYGVMKRRDGQQGSIFFFTLPYRPEISLDQIIQEEEEQEAAAEAEAAAAAGEDFYEAAEQTTVDSQENQVEQSLLGPSYLSKNREISIEPQQQQLPTDPTATDDDHKSVLSHGSRTSGIDQQSESIQSGPPSLLPPSVANKERKPSNSASSTSSFGVSLDILLADDSLSMSKTMKKLLERSGHQVTLAANGDLALKSLENHWKTMQRGYDVILMDMQMPVMDGLEATKRIRKIEKEKKEYYACHPEELNQEFLNSICACDMKVWQMHNCPIFSKKGGTTPKTPKRQSGSSLSGATTSPADSARSSFTGSESRHSSLGGTGAGELPEFRIEDFLHFTSMHDPLQLSLDNGQSDPKTSSHSQSHSRSQSTELTLNSHKPAAYRGLFCKDCSKRIVCHQYVVATSANDDEETIEIAKEAGVDDFLVKPFSMKQFEEVLRALV